MQNNNKYTKLVHLRVAKSPPRDKLTKRHKTTTKTDKNKEPELVPRSSQTQDTRAVHTNNMKLTETILTSYSNNQPLK